ncbi:UDP-glucosyltransferase A1 [Cladobotryum mycophilum]|uniref:UDP-glucosyltransferase A1 n=1 Tax=Cladobotryum mycophilum TaxID=491253 RepID=A0ABR0SJT3_9HYPO
MPLLSDAPQKPLLVFMSIPAEGHTNPLLTIAAHLIKQGYDVAYLCSESFRTKVENVGAEFIKVPELFEDGFELLPPEYAHLSNVSIERQVRQVSHIFYRKMPLRAQDAMRALESLRKRNPERQIIVVEDIMNMGVVPLHYGAPLPAGFDKPIKRIGISPAILMVQSQDTGPNFLALPPDSTESGRLRNKVLHRLMAESTFKPLTEAMRTAFKASGVTNLPDKDPLSVIYTSHDVTLMLCSPSLEYPRSDIPSSIKFMGCLPRREVNASFKHPSWWSEIVENSSTNLHRKKVVFVAQGTVNTDYHELIEPTFEALSGRKDTLIIAALGVRGATLPEDIEVPENARVVDYIPYDAVLEHADVFISNAGYGGMVHAVMNGVPAVLGGETEEKAEVVMRAAWAGFAWNLKSQTPTSEQVREGVDNVLGDAAYKNRAMELRRENESLNSLQRIEEVVASFTE